MWYAFYKTKTGELVSTADEFNPNLPKDVTVVELGEDFDQAQLDYSIVWNKVNLTFDVKPIPVIQTKQERLDEIATELGLTAEQKTLLEAKL